MDYVKNIDLCRCLSLLLVVCTQSEEFKKEVQKFTAPVYGSYKIQCWGAQGAFSLENLEYVSGKGGYSEGIWRPTTVNTIYICLGQLGSAAYFKGQIASLAYNNSPDNINGFLLGGSGGGATSVTVTNRGELKNFASDDRRKEVLIVAGGGGALEWAGQGGAGGGLTGKDGNPKPNESRKGIGGSQDSGGITGVHSGDTSVNGMFGVGGYGYTYNDYYKSIDYGTQGGGGWYGGGGASYTGAAGGGSSYIGGVTDGKTIAGDCTDPKQPTPDGKSEQIGQSGNGACVITQLSFN
mgnify:CR=1 FL=1